MDIDGKKILRGAIAGRPLVTAVGADQVLILDDTDGEPKRALASDLGGGDMVLADVQTVTGVKTFGTAGGAVGKLKLAGSTSGSTILNAAAAAGSGTVVLPTTGTLATLTGTETLTNKTLTTPKISIISDSNGNESLVMITTASAANHIQLTNAAVAGHPQIKAVGDATNINLILRGKGTGFVEVADLSLEGNVTGGGQTIDDVIITGTTIDSSLNTITNIVNADISASAQVALSKLEDISQNDIIGRVSSGAGAPEALSSSTVRTIAGVGFQVDANTQITPSTAIVLDQATGNEIALDLQYTTNKATSGDDTGLLINQTDTASPGTSLLIDAQVGGVSQMVLDNAGRLGIGTASPGKNVHISSSGANTGFRLTNTGTDGRSYTFVTTSSADPIGGGKFSISDNDAAEYRFVINSTGNVGIGTTSPAQALDVVGSIVASGVANQIPIYTEAHAASHTIDAAECYGGVHYVTAASVVITLPPVAVGMSVTIVSETANMVDINPDGTEVINLDGTAAAAGENINSPGAVGDICVLTYRAANTWYAATNSWVEATP